MGVDLAWRNAVSEMVERVAKAIHGAYWDEDWYRMDPNGVERALTLQQARAAIEAMREPNTAMIAQGESAASFGIGQPTDEEAIPRVWHWMIDAALSKAPPSKGTEQP